MVPVPQVFGLTSWTLVGEYTHPPWPSPKPVWFSRIGGPRIWIVKKLAALNSKLLQRWAVFGDPSSNGWIAAATTHLSIRLSNFFASSQPVKCPLNQWCVLVLRWFFKHIFGITKVESHFLRGFLQDGKLLVIDEIINYNPYKSVTWVNYTP